MKNTTRKRHVKTLPHHSTWLPGTVLYSQLVFILSCCLTLFSQNCHAYNIDLPSYVRHHMSPDTMFGYSLAFFQGVKGNPSTYTLLIGAPKITTTNQLVENGGVFRCGMYDNSCNLLQFDAEPGNSRNTLGERISQKSYQWFGATVTTSQNSDAIVACAPRFIFHTMKPSSQLRYDPVGTCFVSRNFTSFHEVSPCRTSAFGYHRQGSCQAGFSAAISKNGQRFFIGAPGSWYWQGQVYSLWPDATFPYKPPQNTPFGTEGRSFTFDMTRPENQIFATTEGSKFDDDSYLGYSMITGNFSGNEGDDVAIGMPRGSHLKGKIVVNRWNMVNIFNITGRQIGEYFGYSLATTDVDGDGLDDLIIGAPMYSDPANVQGHYDVGRVYILLQKSTSGPERWITEHIRDGYNSKSRFGTALTALGDINRDGYGDFAVGAPYDGIEGRGVVYIFHGSPHGPLLKPSQIIKAEDIVESSVYPHTFGFSLAGGVDMDGNTYPDLAVGAYGSGEVYIFKSRPVASVTAMTTFANKNKLIDLDDKRCLILHESRKVPCTDITTCWSYRGDHLPGTLNFDVSWVLDAKKPKNPRMFFLHDEGKNVRNQTISLDYGKTFCRNETVYISDNIHDKLTPLEVESRYNLRSAYNAPQYRSKRDTLEPVIDHNKETVPRDVINIQKNCGEDNICVPDLRLEVNTVDKYVLGSREPLTIEVLISNMNEDAFEAAFYMVMPKDLDFKKIKQIGDKTDAPITCTAPSDANDYTLKCDIGNPLPAKNIAKFNVILVPSHKKSMSQSYEIFMEANSTNLEREGSHFDNIIKKSIGIWVETDLSIDGLSLPDSESYNSSNYKIVDDAKKEDDLGPQVVHIYHIHNNGPSIIEEAVVLIQYPFQTVAGDLLMYLTNQPETSGNIQCEYHYNANAKNLQLDPTLSSKSYLEQVYAVKQASTATTATKVEENTSGAESGGFVVSTFNAPKQMSEEELRKLREEDAKFSSGDASFVHAQREQDILTPSVVVSARNVTETSHQQLPAQYRSAQTVEPIAQVHNARNHIQMAPPQQNHVTSYNMRNSNQQQLPQQQTINYGSFDASQVPKSGGGFQVGTFDFGPGQTQYMDNELRRQNNYGVQSPYQKSTSHSFGSNRPYYGVMNKDDYYEDYAQRSGNPKRRLRRQDNTADQPTDFACKSAKCEVVRCVAKNLGKDDEVWVSLRTRLVAHTLAKLSSDMPLNVSTMAVSIVTKLPYIGQPKDEIKRSHEIFYKAIPELPPKPDVVPLWVVVLAACVGTMILLLLIFLLYKCGFFKRNRPTDPSMERQPLRNGYHGDEHL